ncbi:hypothetical protein [Bacillus toyonensis]
MKFYERLGLKLAAKGNKLAFFGLKREKVSLDYGKVI